MPVVVAAGAFEGQAAAAAWGSPALAARFEAALQLGAEGCHRAAANVGRLFRSIGFRFFFMAVLAFTFCRLRNRLPPQDKDSVKMHPSSGTVPDLA